MNGSRESIGKWVFLFIVLCMLNACAGVSFYRDEALTQETGIKFYTAKPYLLICRTDAKDKPVEIAVVNLPDLENPLYAKVKEGIGNSNMEFSLNNGMLASYGQTIETGMPEMTQALSGLLTGMGGTFKTVAEGMKVLEETSGLRMESADTEKIQEAKKIIEKVIADIPNLVPKTKIPEHGLTGVQADLKEKLLHRLKEICSELTGPGAAVPGKLKEISGRLDSVINDMEMLTVKETVYMDFLNRLIRDLKGASDLIAPAPPPEPSFLLYEIRMDKGETRLIRVKTD